MKGGKLSKVSAKKEILPSSSWSFKYRGFRQLPAQVVKEKKKQQTQQNAKKTQGKNRKQEKQGYGKSDEE